MRQCCEEAIALLECFTRFAVGELVACDICRNTGNSKDSRLMHRILGLGGEARMPMGGQLKPEQVELVKRWIDEGATWPEADAATR